MSKPIIDKTLPVEKFPGKGGWTYVVIEAARPDSSKPFGWRKVRGTIDHYQLNQYKLMPMGNGKLFLPLKAAIRKAIGKKEGDKVHVILFDDDSNFVIPEDIQACLDDFPKAKSFFESMTESNQKYYVDWIQEAKTMETTVKRINEMIDKLLEGRKIYD
ncbi:YdeI/OmpD-associated family protein [Jiulongibacter sediminis]|jgi:bifunctional DNA-binding transcriptional regulator/antitoxin component of YhaV-PrlF toxin-antitoxin module|uniref:YdeI/OmpD-associated family protein n=1 Tax=Jiulongibacter sediminis TaxID=1605367 RepID=UPI0026EC6D95|nr:YdeI/OmpD-associated family protein [Jiulongibacter sediminis]